MPPFHCHIIVIIAIVITTTTTATTTNMADTATIMTITSTFAPLGDS